MQVFDLRDDYYRQQLLNEMKQIANGKLKRGSKYRAYKYVTNAFKSPFASIENWRYRFDVEKPITYKPGRTIEVKDATTERNYDCGKGICATYTDSNNHNDDDILYSYRTWEEREHELTIVALEFYARDVAAVPYESFWTKMRLRRCKVKEVVGKVSTINSLQYVVG